MKMVLVGVVGVLVVQVLLVGGYLAVSRHDPIILNPERKLDENGIAMVMLCGDTPTISGSGSGVLDKVPPDGAYGPWSRGRANVRGACDIWYHNGVLLGDEGD